MNEVTHGRAREHNNVCKTCAQRCMQTNRDARRRPAGRQAGRRVGTQHKCFSERSRRCETYVSPIIATRRLSKTMHMTTNAMTTILARKSFTIDGVCPSSAYLELRLKETQRGCELSVWLSSGNHSCQWAQGVGLPVSDPVVGSEVVNVVESILAKRELSSGLSSE
jgi:hypothetical protein